MNLPRQARLHSSFPPLTPTVPQHFSFNDSVPEGTSLETVYKQIAVDNTVVISLTSYPYRSMALNFYRGSILRHNITNYLFFASDKAMYDHFRELGIRVLLLPEWKGTDTDLHFNLICKRRFSMVKKTLELGYNVLLTDSDIIYFHNPLPHLLSETHDIVFQDNGNGEVNGGFIFYRPTEHAKAFMQRCIASEAQDSDDQPIINAVLHGSPGDFARLPRDRWPAGGDYYSRRLYLASGTPPILVHNNWVLGLPAKVQRFREEQLWLADREEEFYAAQAAENEGYVYYSTERYTQATGERAQTTQELETLRQGLRISALLNRTLILPKFWCNRPGHPYCWAGNVLHIAMLETGFFHPAGGFRFEPHALIFNAGLSERGLLDTGGVRFEFDAPRGTADDARADEENREYVNYVDRQAVSQTVHIPADTSDTQLLAALAPYRHVRLLRFGPLSGARVVLHDPAAEQAMEEKLTSCVWPCVETQGCHRDIPPGAQ